MSEYKYHIEKITRNNDNAFILDLSDIHEKPVFDFRPGQYVMIYYKNRQGKIEQKHTFSIASSPAENDSLRLGIKVLGPFTTGLSKMKEGDEVFVSGPFGNFVFEENKHQDLVLIAGGIGITPFVSTLRYATHHQLPHKISLLYSSRTLSNTLFLDEILDLKQKNKNLRSLFLITEAKLPQEMAGVINKRINAEIIQNFIRSTHGKTFFVCGPPNFMLTVEEILKNLGVDQRQIKMEGFTMIPDEGWRPKLRNTAYALGLGVAILLLPFYFIRNSFKEIKDQQIQPTQPNLQENITSNAPNVENATSSLTNENTPNQNIQSQPSQKDTTDPLLTPAPKAKTPTAPTSPKTKVS